MDASHFNYEHFIDNHGFNDLFTTSDLLDELKTALHINKVEAFAKTNSTVADAIVDRENNAASLYTDLLARGLKVLIAAGSYDQKDGVRSTLEWIKKIDFPDREIFDLQPRKVYRYYDQFDSTDKVGGWYRHHGNFTAIVVPQAGHMIPAFKPYVSMKFTMDYLNKGHLSCETEDDGNCGSVASSMCGYMNDCNSNGDCNSYGKCECNSGFFGADCSTSVTDLTQVEGNVEETVKASRWMYYSIPASSGDFSLTLSSDKNVQLYMRKGTGAQDIPDAVTYDVLVQNDSNMVITSDIMSFEQGAILAVHCTGEATDNTTFSLQFSSLQNEMIHNSFEFLDLAASAVPSATPSFERGQGMDSKSISGDQNAITDWQYMILGAFFGVLATIVYYKLAQNYLQYRNEQRNMTEMETTTARGNGVKPVPLEDPNTFIFGNLNGKTFKEDEEE